MKKHLVRFNRPLLIKDANTGEASDYMTIYGVLVPYSSDYHEYDTTMDNIWYYAKYLAAMHLWSNGGTQDFSLEGREWVDNEGVVHRHPDEWTTNICNESISKLGLFYTLHTIDTDDYDQDILAEGIVSGLIVSDELMEYLIEDEQFFAALYNRPIFMPKNMLWPGETGYVQIFGTIERGREFNMDMFNNANGYLAYVSMCEECILAGKTPSGYVMDDYVFLKDGRSYSPYSNAIKEESRLCKKKNNLKIVDVVALDYQPEGVLDDFIVSKDLYEELLGYSKKVDVQTQQSGGTKLRAK